MTPEEVVQAVEEQLAPALIGVDPLNILAALYLMDTCLQGEYEAKAALEMALIDLKGKALGVSAGSLLGGRLRHEVWLNAWIGLVSPEQAATEAVQWHQQGFRSAKIKVGVEFQDDVNRVAAVRAAVGPQMQLRVDANEALTVPQAIRLARALESYDITLFEQPVPRHNIAGLAEVRRHSRIPIMADESVHRPESLVQIIKQEAADLVKLKVMKQGGMLRTLHMATMAEAAGLRVVLGHGFGLWMSTLAEAHVAAASYAIMDGCESVGPLKMSADVVKTPPRIEGGKFAVPSTPGLGVEPDERLLHHHGWRKRTVTQNVEVS
jgi:muconate cycloisomerase